MIGPIPQPCWTSRPRRRAELDGGDPARIADELGDLLFTRRFNAMERLAADRVAALGQTCLAETEADWQAVKRNAT